MRTAPYPAPGEIRLHEFLEPLGITQYRLAKAIGVSQRRIGEIVSGDRAVTADTGLRLSRYFGVSDKFWIGLQADFDAAMTKEKLADVLARIEPYNAAARALARGQSPFPAERDPSPGGQRYTG